MSKELTEKDLCEAAKILRCEVALVQAIAEVESRGGGFDSQGRPKILFERHHFSRLTGRKFDATHPHISNRTPGGYTRNEYARFSEAFHHDKEAAMMSASWGKFQVMGFNFPYCGFTSIDAFVDAMKVSERNHLLAAVRFIIHNGLDDELRRRDWRGFARGYNGKNFRKNDYDNKLRSAYERFARRPIDCDKLTDADIDAITSAVDNLGAEIRPVGVTPAETPSDGQIPTTETTPAVQPVQETANQVAPAGETLEPKTVEAPAKESSTKQSIWMTVMGFFGITGVTGALQALQNLATSGFVNTQEVISTMLAIIRENSQMLLVLIALIIIGLQIKKYFKQKSFQQSLEIASRPDRHDVIIKPT